jgi:phage head maturation protease
MNDALVHYGGEVKALGGGRVSGYLVVFGTAEQPDLSMQRDYFTKATDLDIEDGDRKSVYYAHGLDPQLKTKRIGSATVKTDDVGVWIEAQLSLRDEYEKAVYGLVEAGKMGWSSGAPSHLVTRKAVEAKSGESVHEILSWNLSEASLTPTPAEPRADAFALKSLPSLVNLVPTEVHADSAPTTKSRADFTYDDLRALLESEWNEDFPPQMAYGDPYDGWARQVHIVAMDDTTCVGQRGWDGELIRRAYAITAGNDVMWGEPEEVARTTTFVAVTDGDDEAPMMKTITTESAPATLPFGEHLESALAAVGGVIERGFDINDLRIKSGRVLSAANRSKLKDMHTQMQTAHAAMASHITKMGDLLAATDPDAKKDADDFAALRTRFVRLQSELLHMSS